MKAENGLGGQAAISLPAPPKSRLLLGLVAALLVNGGLLLFLQLKRPVTKSPSQALISLRILPEEAPLPERVQLARPPAAMPRMPTAIPVPPPEVAITAPVVAPPVTTQAAEPAPSMTPGPAKPEPLKLALPAGRAASGPRAQSMLGQMLNDERGNSPRRSVEYAVADAAGTLPITVSDSTDGTGMKLVRQGSKCTRVAEARVSKLNPMDKNLQGFAAMSGACTK